MISGYEQRQEQIARGAVEDEPVQPFDEIVFKVHSRCNLACTYCYMYELADTQSWREQPRVMETSTLMYAAEQINRHSYTHGQKEVSVIFHGGEPLLARKSDPDFFDRAVRILNGTVDPEAGTKLNFSMQTNGTLLTPEVLDEFLKLGISVGVSIDGYQAAHDRHRIYPNGKGSFDDVKRGIDLLHRPEYDAICGGVLCVIDLRNDPVQLYETLSELSPKSVGLLLPLGNWSLRPTGYETDADMQTAKYADWLWPIFERWYKRPTPRIGLFAEIVQRLIGKGGNSEYFGTSEPGNIVIETNGEIQQVDSLKSTYMDASKTGRTIQENLLDEVLYSDPLTKHRQLGAAALSEDCQRCSLLNICGGSYLPFRYKAGSEGNGFKNPAVYCNDMKQLIGSIASRMQADFERLATK